MHVRQIAGNSIFIFTGRVFSRILDFFFIILLTNYLSPEELGAYEFIFTYIATFAVFVDLGLNSILIRESAQNPERVPEIMGNGLLVGFVVSFVFIMLSIGIIQVLPVPELMKRLAIAACASILISSRFKSFRTLLEVMYVVELRMGIIALINILDRILLLGAFYLLMSFGPSLYLITVIVVCADIPGFLLTAILYRKFFGNLIFNPDHALIKTLLGYSFPILLMALFNLLNFRVDVLILEFLKGEGAIGYYKTGTRIPEVLAFIPMAFGLSIYPILSKKIMSNRAAFMEIFQTSAKYLLFAGVPIVIYLFINSEQIILFLFKEKYAASIPVLQVVAFAGISLFVSDLFYSALIISKNEKLCFIITAISAAAHIILTYLFVVLYGIIGAGISTLIAYSLFFILGLLFRESREFVRSILLMIIRPALAGVIMGACIYFMPINFIAVIIPGSIIYIAAFLILKGFTAKDFEYFRELIGFRANPDKHRQS